MARAKRDALTGEAILDIIVLGGPLPPAAPGPDCNNNGITDRCEADCNINGVPDDCDIADLTSADCNNNLVPDECDPDCDGDGIPDECDLRAPAIPAAPHDIRKNRFISLDPRGNPCPVAFRVELLDRVCSGTSKKCTVESDCKTCPDGVTPCDWSAECSGSCTVSGETCDEQSPPFVLGWLNDPYDASAPNNPDAPPGTWISRVVSSQPTERDWPESVVHIAGCEIAPGQSYAIRASADGVTFSDPLYLGTTPKPSGPKFWGDMVGDFDGTSWGAPNGVVNVNDVLAWIHFETEKPAPHVTVLDLANEVPNLIINATDLQLVLLAFGGRTYPPDDFDNQGLVTDCSPQVPAMCPASSRSTEPGTPSPFALVPDSDPIAAPGTVRIDVYVDDVASLGAYDVALEVTGGTTGSLTITQVSVERFCTGGTDDGNLCEDAADCADPGTCDDRLDYVFQAGGANEACDPIGGRIASAVSTAGGVQVTGSGYLATFVYQASSDATGTFTIAMKPGDETTFIIDGDAKLLPSTLAQTTVDVVISECNIDADCPAIVCQTVVCANLVCVYTNEPGGTSCDDGDPCTVSDACSSGSCSGSAMNCNDGDVCTTDSCSGGVCQYANNTFSCNDGNLCTVNDVCSGGSCSGSPVSCPSGESCDSSDGLCKECLSNSDCNDGNACTTDTCSSGNCQNTNNSNSCNDGNNCTTGDGCSGGSCSGSPVNCPSGQTCDASTGQCAECITNSDCNDGNICTTDTCVSGTCQNANNTISCNDGDACTVVDMCSGGSCSGFPMNCIDGNQCTDDVCVAGVCQHTNNTARCDDGLYCTSVDSCDGNGTCVGSTSSPCDKLANTTCCEASDLCIAPWILCPIQ